MMEELVNFCIQTLSSRIIHFFDLTFLETENLEIFFRYPEGQFRGPEKIFRWLFLVQFLILIVEEHVNFHF